MVYRQEEAELQRKIEDYRHKVETLKTDDVQITQDTALLGLSGRHVRVYFPNKQHTLVGFNKTLPSLYIVEITNKVTLLKLYYYVG